MEALRFGCALGALLLASGVRAEPAIVVNQVGFPAHWDKEAFLVDAFAGAAPALPAIAEISEAATGKVVAKVPVGARRRDAATGDWIARISFSRVRAEGRYRISVGSLRSSSFVVGPGRAAAPGSPGSPGSTDVYRELERLLLRSFYLQRCGVALKDPVTSAHHEACHLHDGQLIEPGPPDASLSGGPRPGASARPWDTTGGWHDAGDYGKYVATTAVSIGRVLHALERDPDRYRFDDLGIPESGNGIPDLVDEMKVGLDWMLKMQRPDGAVYRKVGGKQWPPKVVPEQDAQARYVYGVTSPETAKAAAAWALASRLFRPWYPQESARYLAAARRAWQWVEQQPAQVFDWHDGDDSGSGPYRSNEVDVEASLHYDTDDRLWAATELAITTAEPQWRPIVKQLARRAPVNIYEWKDASLLALSYLLWHPAMRSYGELARTIGQRVVKRAQVPLAHVARSKYRLANQRFVWGSNKMAAEEGFLMCTAYHVSGRRDLLLAAREQLHYLLGRNHFGTSFVSLVGERSVHHPTHIFAESAKVELPGLFVGGPNEAEQSNIAPRHQGALSWIDDHRSYATNEYAIDYDASLFGLTAALSRDCFR